MPQYTAILRQLPLDKFKEIFAASSRQARETYFHRHDVPTPKAARIPKPGAKNEQRVASLFEILRDRDDDEMAEEILRTWLLSKRPMLAAALDHMGIPHQGGLTESDDVKKFEKLSHKDIKALAKKLEGVAPKDDIIVYLTYMGAEKVSEALG